MLIVLSIQLLETKENAKRKAEQAVMDLTEKVKQLTNEKDALNGELEAIRYQKTQYAQHVAEIDQVRQKYQAELEELKQKLEKQSYTREDVDILQAEVLSAKESIELFENAQKRDKVLSILIVHLVTDFASLLLNSLLV